MRLLVLLPICVLVLASFTFLYSTPNTRADTSSSGATNVKTTLIGEVEDEFGTQYYVYEVLEDGTTYYICEPMKQRGVFYLCEFVDEPDSDYTYGSDRNSNYSHRFVDSILVIDEFEANGVKYYTYEMEANGVKYYTYEFKTEDRLYGYARGGKCDYLATTADASAYSRCVIVDKESPRIIDAFVTAGNYTCAEVIDNTEVVKVTFNGKVIARWPGSNNYYCDTGEQVSMAIRIVARDSAGNESKMVTIDRQRLAEPVVQKAVSATKSTRLNPHYGVEGVALSSTVTANQLRMSVSGLHSNAILLSDYALKEIVDDYTLVVKYIGQYANTFFGKEQHGYLDIFGANMGHIARFDIHVADDMILNMHKEQNNKGYTLGMKEASEVEKSLNAFQRAELERILSSTEPLTDYQKALIRMLAKSL
ncbi:MAG: hypothetical protein QXU32_10750 [Nitrososphaerales archaeon]